MLMLTKENCVPVVKYLLMGYNNNSWFNSGNKENCWYNIQQQFLLFAVAILTITILYFFYFSKNAGYAQITLNLRLIFIGLRVFKVKVLSTSILSKVWNCTLLLTTYNLNQHIYRNFLCIIRIMLFYKKNHIYDYFLLNQW